MWVELLVWITATNLRFTQWIGSGLLVLSVQREYWTSLSTKSKGRFTWTQTPQLHVGATKACTVHTGGHVAVNRLNIASKCLCEQYSTWFSWCVMSLRLVSSCVPASTSAKNTWNCCSCLVNVFSVQSIHLTRKQRIFKYGRTPDLNQHVHNTDTCVTENPRCLKETKFIRFF